MGHSVVVLGRTNDGNFIVADPAVGLEILGPRPISIFSRRESGCE